MNNLRVWMGALLLVFSLTVFAQEKMIEGRVTDMDGNPMVGVTVVPEGTDISVTTDENGYYRIPNVPDDVMTVRFTHPDMENASASIGLYTTIDVEMAKKGSDFLMEYSLEDLLNMEVVTASKKAEKSTDAPGVVHTITKEEIKYFGGNNLGEVLERAASIQKIGSHLFPNNNTIVRGDLRTLYDNHVLILIDGIPIREGITGGVNSPVYQGLPVEIIERIEIIRGPGSVLYGTNAFAGVVNIITRGNQGTSLSANATAGSYGTVGGNITGIYSKSDFKGRLGAKYENVDGWDYSATTARPGSPNVPVDMKYGRKNISLLGDVAYKGLSFYGFYTQEDQAMLGIIPYAPFAGKNKVSRLIMNVGYTHDIGDAWEASINVLYNGTDMRLGDEAQTAVDHQESDDYMAELTINGELLENLNLVIGGVLDARNKNNVGPSDAIPVTYNQLHMSTYLQMDYRPIEPLKLIAGAQLNKPDVGDIDIVPRLGAIFNFTDNIGMKALYGSAFRSPWPIEQLLQNPAIVGNPNLEPEKITTLDIQLFFSSKKVEGSFTYFNSAYSNSISRAPLNETSNVFTYINQGELHMNGYEFEGKVTLSSNLFITGSATYQNNADEQTVPVYIPDFMAKVGFFYKTSFGLTPGVFNTYYGKPRANNGVAVNPEAKAVDLLSVNLNYKLPVSTPIELNLNVQNLLNTSYYYTEFSRGWVNTLPVQPGVGVYGKVSVKL